MAFPGSSGGAWQPSVASPVRKRRWGRVLVGSLGLLLLALPLLAGGLVVAIASSAWNAGDPEGEGRVPGSMSLDAEDGRKYVVALGNGLFNEPGRRRGFNETVATDIRCTITHPDGSTDKVRGDRQGSSVSRHNYATVGTFQGKGGETSVDCTSTSKDLFGEERDLPMIVHDINGTWRWVWIGLLIAGAVVGLLSGALLASGIRGSPVPALDLLR
ncbi:hypothetical protein [Nocardioides sp. WS12]|uniref:hypothetical protein n=1 Tax=Nocardioides sp. WS12 TaxID=2486272 RepID=UPI0015FDC845|nr:hypothetical protein [Nocardioides sp. WS12]